MDLQTLEAMEETKVVVMEELIRHTEVLHHPYRLDLQSLTVHQLESDTQV